MDGNFLDIKFNILPCDRKQQAFRVAHAQPLGDVAEVGARSGRGERQHLRVFGQRFDERPDTAVVLAKAVLDLRQDMRLVNDHAAHMRGGKCGAHVLTAELLRRKVEKAAVYGKVSQNISVHGRAEVGVQQGGVHASALECLYLIALQRAQGRENKRERTRLIEQCRQLVQ